MFCKPRPISVLCLAAALVVVGVGWLPYCFHLNGVCQYGDWWYMYNTYEAISRTILDFGQFPFWNPWSTGGKPLFAHPCVGVLSVETLLAVLFGSVLGVNLSVLVYLLVGCLGMWLLLSDITDSLACRAWGTILFGLEGAFSLHIAAGHLVMLSLMLLPLALYLAMRSVRSRSAGLGLTTIMALVALGSVHYQSVWIFLLVGCAMLAAFAAKCIPPQTTGARGNGSPVSNVMEGLRRVLRALAGPTRGLPPRAESTPGNAGSIPNSALATDLCICLLLFLSLVAYRIAVTGAFFVQFPRTIDARGIIPFGMLVKALVYPGQHPLSFYPEPLPGVWTWHEMGAHIGVVAVVMFLVSFRHGVRWWQVGAVFFALLTLDSQSKFLPGYWIRELPLFKSMWVITRCRLFCVFFLIIGSVIGLETVVRAGGPRRGRFLVGTLIVGVSVCELLYNQYYQWHHVSWQSEQSVVRSVPLSSPTIINSSRIDQATFAAARKGMGLIFVYEPMLGYSSYERPQYDLTYKSCRIPVEDSRYKGEVVGLLAPLDPRRIVWTPNRITFEVDQPNLVHINQNPGDYWRLDGVQLFPKYRSFEMAEPFVVRCETPGRYVLEVVPPLHRLGLAATGLFGILLLGLLWFRLRRKRRENGQGEPGGEAGSASGVSPGQPTACPPA